MEAVMLDILTLFLGPGAGKLQMTDVPEPDLKRDNYAVPFRELK